MPDRADGVYALILAGGRGTRFWPWSRRSQPKPCLAPDGGRSLLQATMDRVLGILPPERVLVVTAADVAAPIRAQLPELPPQNILVEPQPRNTAAAVAWGTMEVSRRARGQNPVVLVLPSDHRVEQEAELQDLLLDCAQAARATNALVTIGITPTRPETGFGYMAVGSELGRWGDRAFLRVERFVEKPDLERARRWVEEGTYAWNAGMFVFTVDSVRDAFRQFLPRTWMAMERLAHDPERLVELYGEMEATSIDCGVLERSPHVLTVRADLGWSDLGTWEALAGLLPRVEGGCGRVDGAVAIEARDNLIFAPEDLVALVGVEGLLIARHQGVLLICPRERAREVQALLPRLEGGPWDERV